MDTLAPEPFRLNLAPEHLWQPINPWTFDWSGAQLGNVTINLGQTSKPEVERKILDEVASYGRQLGRIGDALEVLIGEVDRSRLTAKQDDALTILLGQLAEIRKVKSAGNSEE